MKRERTLRERLRGLLHGPVLGTIASSVPIKQDDGSEVYLDVPTWKEWFVQKFLGPEGSTEALPEDELHRFILAVESFAATRMGVTFKNRRPLA